MTHKAGFFVKMIVIFGVWGTLIQAVHAAPYKVLVVQSYEEDFPWCKEIKEGIDSVLAQTCEIRYFYMNTKTTPAGGEQKAKEAFALYQEFQPDGVITSDDNAQTMFVLPYLKDKVKTPVMFCGVNAPPDKYGYPAANVSGILERYHIMESISFAKQVVPTIETVGFMGKESETARAGMAQVESESSTYPAKYTDFKFPKTLSELEAMAAELRDKCDAVLLLTLAGIPKADGTPLSDKEGIPMVAKIFGKPLIGVSAFQADYGVLCTVLNSGQEQGKTSADMLMKAMQGTPISEIPITKNYQGRRVININVMKDLGITPKPEVLRGAQLVKTE